MDAFGTHTYHTLYRQLWPITNASRSVPQRKAI